MLLDFIQSGNIKCFSETMICSTKQFSGITKHLRFQNHIYDSAKMHCIMYSKKHLNYFAFEPKLKQKLFEYLFRKHFVNHKGFKYFL